jgi:hypothetical protein
MADTEHTTHLVMCECHGEIISFDDWGDDDPFVEVQMYFSSDYGFWGRIRAGLRYIRMGESAFSGMTIGKDKIPALIEYLQSVISDNDPYLYNQ